MSKTTCIYGKRSIKMSDLDLQIFFEELFDKCNSSNECKLLYDRILINLDLCYKEYFELMEK